MTMYDIIIFMCNGRLVSLSAKLWIPQDYNMNKDEETNKAFVPIVPITKASTIGIKAS